MTQIAGLALLALPTLVLADDEASEPIPITDPVLLERFGFEPDATNVFATPRALRHMAMSPEEGEAEQQGPLDASEASPAGGPYGTSSFGYTSAHANDFLPRTNQSGDANWDTSPNHGRWCLNGGSPAFRAQLHGLPHGADLRQVSFYVYDATNVDVSVFLWRACQANAGGPQVVVLLDSASTSGAPGNEKLDLGCIPSGGFPPTLCPINSELHELIDLESCVYFVGAHLGGCDGFTGIIKARARWERLVSPAPTTATFDDVPTSNLFFRYVEALAASGITSGCDANSFCPNAPLTRAQMAVFLARALGLHWDHIPQ